MRSSFARGGVRGRAPRTSASRAVPLGLALACVAACTPRGSAAPTTAPSPVVTAPLPPVPHVAGPLDVRVVYPVAGSLVQARDSNFIFGSVGNGDATLTIDGASVPVAPNGAFLAWLP